MAYKYCYVTGDLLEKGKQHSSNIPEKNQKDFFCVFCGKKTN